MKPSLLGAATAAVAFVACVACIACSGTTVVNDDGGAGEGGGAADGATSPESGTVPEGGIPVEGGVRCSPGAFVFCRCADRTEGTKQCRPDGQGFDPCTTGMGACGGG